MVDHKIKELDNAFKGVIYKWKGISSLKLTDRGSANCPFCQLFSEDGFVKCGLGCPIYKKTGQKACGNTPYADWYQYQFANGQNSDDGMFVWDDKSKELAENELKFLENLYGEWKEKV